MGLILLIILVPVLLGAIPAAAQPLGLWSGGSPASSSSSS